MSGNHRSHAMKFETMENLFLGQIQDLYDAEQRLVKALPDVAGAVILAELRHAFDKHLQIFAQMGKEMKRIREMPRCSRMLFDQSF
jgi:ferritin-like metal-binding protein YciE